MLWPTKSDILHLQQICYKVGGIDWKMWNSREYVNKPLDLGLQTILVPQLYQQAIFERIDKKNK